MRSKKTKGLCITASPEVDEKAHLIGDYVWTNPQYPNHQRLEFSKGGDAWVIAHAWHDKGTVVSWESDRFPNSQRVRIPDVCHHFQEIRCLTLNQLIRELNPRF
jgi:hypothetical protein